MTENKAPALNWQKGVNTFGGDEELYKSMIESFYQMSFNEQIQNCYIYMRDKDWANLKTEAHALKGSSGYIGAEEFSNNCQNVQNTCQNYMDDQKNEELFQDMLESYYAMMQSAISLKIYIEKQQIDKIPDVTKLENEIKEIEKLFGKSKLSIEEPSDKAVCCSIY